MPQVCLTVLDQTESEAGRRGPAWACSQSQSGPVVRVGPAVFQRKARLWIPVCCLTKTCRWPQGRKIWFWDLQTKTEPQKVLKKRCNYYIILMFCSVTSCVGSTSGALEKCVGAQSCREVGSGLNPGTPLSPHSPYRTMFWSEPWSWSQMCSLSPGNLKHGVSLRSGWRAFWDQVDTLVLPCSWAVSALLGGQNQGGVRVGVWLWPDRPTSLPTGHKADGDLSFACEGGGAAL